MCCRRIHRIETAYQGKSIMSEGKSRLYPILVNTLDVAATPVTGRPVASLDVALRQDSEV